MRFGFVWPNKILHMLQNILVLQLLLCYCDAKDKDFFSLPYTRSDKDNKYVGSLQSKIKPQDNLIFKSKNFCFNIKLSHSLI